MPSKYPRGTSHSVMTIRSRKDWDEYLRERLCKIPSTPPTSVIIEEIIESPVDSRAPALKKGQAMPAIEGFTPLVLALPAIAKPSSRFIQKGSPVVPAIQGFDPLVLPRPIQGISRAPGPKALKATLPNPTQSSLVRRSSPWHQICILKKVWSSACQSPSLKRIAIVSHRSTM